jgi:hypothetical protein
LVYGLRYAIVFFGILRDRAAKEIANHIEPDEFRRIVILTAALFRPPRNPELLRAPAKHHGRQASSLDQQTDIPLADYELGSRRL